jgi:hypothetical protein
MEQKLQCSRLLFTVHYRLLIVENIFFYPSSDKCVGVGTAAFNEQHDFQMDKSVKMKLAYPNNMCTILIASRQVLCYILGGLLCYQ